MQIKGKYIDLIETQDSYNNTPFLTLTLILEIDMDIRSQKKGTDFSFPKEIAFEYKITNYLKKGEVVTSDHMYHHLHDLAREARQYDNFMIGVNYYMLSSKSKNIDKYFTTLKINDAYKMSAFDNDAPPHVDYDKEFPLPEGQDGLPF